jgi:hypothetical protein
MGIAVLSLRGDAGGYVRAPAGRSRSRDHQADTRGRVMRSMRIVGALRCVVGAALLVAPDVATNGDIGRRILVRTIGIRDLVLGAGTLLAGRGADAKADGGGVLWVRATLSSDIADVLLALASHRELGTRGTLLAALTPVPFVASGVRTVRRSAAYQVPPLPVS